MLRSVLISPGVGWGGDGAERLPLRMGKEANTKTREFAQSAVRAIYLVVIVFVIGALGALRGGGIGRFPGSLWFLRWAILIIATSVFFCFWP